MNRQNHAMADLTLATLSDELGNLAETRAASVLQVLGARRPASGVVHGPDTIVTTARAIGREDGLRVRRPDGETIETTLVGWDPGSGIAVLRAAAPLAIGPPALATAEPRAGEIVMAMARSWSNAPTATVGTVAVVGGPLRTGRRRELARVIRVTAPMHDGFAGGGVFDARGALTGIATATAIRGFGVVVPASIAWASAAQLLAGGTPRRGFIGLAVQPVQLPASQREGGRDRALLVVAITDGGPAEAAGIIVGDVLLEFDGRRTESADDLLEALSGSGAGQTLTARTLRGGAARDVHLTVAQRV